MTITAPSPARTSGAATAPAGTALAGAPGIPFGRLLRVEVRKLVDTRSGRGLLVAIAALTLLGVGAQVWFGEGENLTYQSLLSSAMVPQGLLIPVFGILAVTAELSQRTGLTTYALEPRRWRVVMAKALAALGFSALLFALAAAFAAPAHLAAVARHGIDADWSIAGGMLGGLAVTQALLVLQGVAFGLFFRSPALAIVVYFALPTVFTIGTSLVERLSDVREWIDLGTASLPLYTGEMTAQGWAHLASASAIWIALPFALGTWLLSRREIA